MCLTVPFYHRYFGVTKAQHKIICLCSRRAHCTQRFYVAKKSLLKYEIKGGWCVGKEAWLWDSVYLCSFSKILSFLFSPLHDIFSRSKPPLLVLSSSPLPLPSRSMLLVIEMSWQPLNSCHSPPWGGPARSTPSLWEEESAGTRHSSWRAPKHKRRSANEKMHGSKRGEGTLVMESVSYI